MVKLAVGTNTCLTEFSHWDNGESSARVQVRPDAAAIIVTTREQHAGAEQVVDHDLIEIEKVGGLAQRDLLADPASVQRRSRQYTLGNLPSVSPSHFST